MALIGYDDRDAAAFADTLEPAGLTGWRAAVDRQLRPHAGMRLLDLGAGTGAWARAFTEWYGVHVVAVEPAAPMRARAAYPLVGGVAEALPLAAATVDAVWISTVIHHLPDLAAVARELRRVARPGAPVLIRSVFPGRYGGVSLLRFFPAAGEVVDRYPSVGRVCATFAGAGFDLVALEPVGQISAPSWPAAVERLRRDAHTPLKLMPDDAYAEGVSRLRAYAGSAVGPVVDTLDLLVLRAR